jgi:exopolysaccharide biosynthesis polyprenyl glycosylphosphotransferase
MTATRKILPGLVALDALAVWAVFNGVSFGWLRGGSGPPPLIVLPLAGPLAMVMIAVYLIDGYKSRTDMMSLGYTSLHVVALACAVLATLLMTFVVIPEGYELQSSRAVIALSFLLLTPVTLSYRRLIYRRTNARRGARRLVFVGDESSSRNFAEECKKTGTIQPVVYSVTERAPSAGVVPPAERPRFFDDVLADIEAGRLAVEAIVLRESDRELQPDIAGKLVALYFRGVPTYTLELFHQVYWRKIPLYRLNQTWLFQEGFQIAREPVFERIKRVADIALSLAGLVLGSPFLLLGGLAVWLQDRGPVFFAQTRIGKNHVPFRLYKLRSMRPDGGGALYTQRDDRRVTRVGRLLRAARLDELPQLWNVLRGDMSLIGPRAEWDQLVEGYERDIPCYHFRHLVKPGITGWAQVNYPYGANREDTVRKLEYDLFYIRHFSFILDASIVLKTIHLMLSGRGR